MWVYCVRNLGVFMLGYRCCLPKSVELVFVCLLRVAVLGCLVVYVVEVKCKSDKN